MDFVIDHFGPSDRLSIVSFTLATKTKIDLQHNTYNLQQRASDTHFKYQERYSLNFSIISPQDIGKD